LRFWSWQSFEVPSTCGVQGPVEWMVLAVSTAR
jgi:hypothetical protein